MGKVLYDFGGKVADRSEIKYEFDGLNATVTIEDQSNLNGHIEISFLRVANFDFESIVIQSDYPVDIAEKLVEEVALPDIMRKIRPEARTLFGAGLKQYAIFLQDFGTFSVVACSVEVKPVS